MSDQNGIDRRDLLKLGAAGLGLGVTGGLSSVSAAEIDAARQERPNLGPAPETPFAADPIDVVRIGFVGVGLHSPFTNNRRRLLKTPCTAPNRF